MSTMNALDARERAAARPRVKAPDTRLGGPLFLGLSLLPHGRGPALPAFTPDHRQLVVPNELSDNVLLVSLERLAVEQVIPLRAGSRPWQAKVLPDGRLAYVTNSQFASTAAESSRAPSTVSVVDLASCRVLEEIVVGAGANGVTVDQRGRRGYVVNMRSNTVSVIDLATHTVLTEIPTGRAPAFAKLSRDLDGHLLVVTNLEDSTLTVVDTARLEVLHTIPVGVPGLNDAFPEWGAGDTTGVAISHREVAYVTNYRSHTIAIVDLQTAAVRKIASPIRFPFFVEIDRDHDLVLFSSGVEQKFALMDMHTEDWLGIYPSDGSVVPAWDVLPMNLWMTDPARHRLTAILPGGIAGISADWDRNMVTKFL